MSRHDHDNFCDKLADYAYMLDDYDPNNPIYNDDISTFSSHPVDRSYELTEGRFLGKKDVHFEDRFDYYGAIIDQALADIDAKKNGGR